MKIVKKPFFFAVCYSLFLICLSAFLLLEAFVIPHDFSSNDPPITAANQDEQTFAVMTFKPSDTERETSGTQSGVDSDTATVSGSRTEDTVVQPIENDFMVPDNSELIGSHADDNIIIRLYKFRYLDTNVYAADVRLTSAEYFKKAFAKNKFGKNIRQTTSKIATDNNAILAINGDYYGADDAGYVIKNGEVYRTSVRKDYKNEDLVVYRDGTFGIINEKQISAEQLLSDGVYQLFAFGPTLIKDGDISVGEKDEVGVAMTSNPRCALGYIDTLHYVFLVSDGRTDESEGLSLHSLATVMKNLGCTIAYNLDGGGSATMWFKGEVVNFPTTHGYYDERNVSDIVYIG